MARKKYSNFTWSTSQVNDLIRQWPKLPASVIAKNVNKSRSAVLGKVRRLGLRK